MTERKRQYGNYYPDEAALYRSPSHFIVVMHLRSMGADNPRFYGTPILPTPHALAKHVCATFSIIKQRAAQNAITEMVARGEVTFDDSGRPVLHGLEDRQQMPTGPQDMPTGPQDMPTSRQEMPTTPEIGQQDMPSNTPLTRDNASGAGAPVAAINLPSFQTIQPEGSDASLWKEEKGRPQVFIEAPKPPTPQSKTTASSEMTEIPVVHHGMGRSSGVVQMDVPNKYKKSCASCHQTVHPKMGRMLSGWKEHRTNNRAVCLHCAEMLRSRLTASSNPNKPQKYRSPREQRLLDLEDKVLDIIWDKSIAKEEKDRLIAEIDEQKAAIKEEAA